MSKTDSGKKTDGAKQSIFARVQSHFVFRLFLSIIIAIIVWLTVYTSYINKPGDKRINAPLMLLNRSALDNLNLELRTENFRSSVEVYLIGREEDLDKIQQGDIEAYIDFADVTGVNDTSLKVGLQSANTKDVKIQEIDPPTIPIAVEARQTKWFDIDVRFSGELPDGLFLTNYSRFPTTRSYTGRESVINRIDQVYVEIDLNKVAGNSVFHQQCHIIGADNKEISHIGWEQIVDVTLEVSKDVPVIPNVTGSPAEDYYVRYTTVTPETVAINGTKEALEKVDSLFTDSLDIAMSRQSISTERAILLPNNVRMSQDKLPRAVVDVTIYRYQYTQDVSLSKGRIEIINSQPDYRYEIVDNEIPLTLKGKVDDIANLDPSQISAVVDVSGLLPGTHAVSAIVSLPDGITNVIDVILTVIVA